MWVDVSAPQYRIHQPLGRGGMGVVFLGTMSSAAGERRVAIKQLTDGPGASAEAVERMVAEAKLVFQLQHANICQVLDLGRNSDGTFMVMEFVDGFDLRVLCQRLRKGGRAFDVAPAVHIAREVAQ